MLSCKTCCKFLRGRRFTKFVNIQLDIYFRQRLLVNWQRCIQYGCNPSRVGLIIVPFVQWQGDPVVETPRPVHYFVPEKSTKMSWLMTKKGQIIWRRKRE